MRRLATIGFALTLCLFTLVPELCAQRAAPPRVSANVIGIGGDSPESFVGKFGGDDLLPYTDDDNSLEPGVNFGGAWGFSHMDLDSDNRLDDGEPVLFSIPSADSTLYSTLTRPEYGTLYESEDWVAFFEANQRGPNGVFDGTETNADFEINDWNGWTDESNVYIYNNLGDNQRGLGYAKYRVDYRSVPLEEQEWVLDEIEGFKKSFGFRNTEDDPDTPFNERGDCRRFYRPRDSVDMRGYVIPTDDLETLEDGSMPTLFGWETGSTINGAPIDLAAYFRDTIAPLLDHPDTNIWIEGTGLTREQIFPLTHLYLLQIKLPMTVDNAENECGDPAIVRSHADYWGIPADGSGTYRQSFLMGMNMALSNAFFDMHPLVDRPEDGAELNLWLQDHFWREDEALIGKYAIDPQGTPVLITIHPLAVRYDETDDSILRIQDAGSVSAPMSRPLGAAETPTIVVADLAIDLDAPVDVGGDPATAYQIIVRNGDDVIAYADIDEGSTRVSLGGTFDAASGTASGGTPGPAGPGAVLGELDSLEFFADFGRFVLVVGSDGASLRQAESGDFTVNDFTGLTEIGDQLASASGAVPHGDGVAQVTIATDGRAAVDTLLVFASPGVGPFLRGDCNQDTSVDISDGIRVLGFLFLGLEAPDCLAACAGNGQNLDLSSAVFIFNFLFLGGPTIPSPFPRPGYSQNPADVDAGCESYSP